MNKKSNKNKIHVYTIDQEYKNIIVDNSYLGKKGYTIPKKCLTTEDY